jgi:hypothetical protein
MAPAWRYLGDGNQDKRTVRQFGMRQDQSMGRQQNPVMVEKIEVESARAPAPPPSSACRFFDFPKFIEQ